MAVNDVPAAQAIEASVQLAPWDHKIFQDCLEAGYDCWVIEQKNEIVAFAVLYIAKSIREAHLMNICVNPNHQQQGIGRGLLRYLLKYAGEYVDKIILEVRRSNKIALQLYQQMGFKVIGERKGYYAALNGREDAIILSYNYSALVGNSHF